MEGDNVFNPPDGFEWFSDQIAGHLPCIHKKGKRQIGILKRPGSTVIHKPCQEGQRGEREVNSYLHILHNEWKGNEEEKKKMEELKKYVPLYYGIEKISIDGEDHSLMILEDITHTYRLPVILDIKMGLVTFDPEAKEDKKKSEMEKYPPQKKIGFRICGYRMHTENGVIYKDKEWGKSFNENTVHQAFREYLSARMESNVLNGMINRLNEILDWFNSQRLIHFYSSSLLFIYESNPLFPPSIDIRLIDFSHTFPANNEADYNYIPGLINLISMIKSISI